MSSRPRIAWFSPIDPIGDSIADYSTRQILPCISEYFEVTLFTDRTKRLGIAEFEDHFLNAQRTHRGSPFDLFVYNIEDHPRARFVRAHLGLVPGVVWLHEAALADFGAEAFHASPWELTLDQFLNNEAPFNPRKNPIHPLWPFAYRELSLATLVLSSSLAVLKRLGELSSRRLEAAPGSHRLFHLPLPTTLSKRVPPPAHDGIFHVAAACRPGVEGQMHKVFPALKALRSPWSLTWMIDQSEAPLAGRVLDEFNVRSQVELRIGRAPATWEEIVSRSTIALHLHNSPFYRTSPYLELSLLAGRPTVVSSYPAYRDWDDDVVFTIEPSMFGTAQLRGIFEAVRRQEWRQEGVAYSRIAERNDPAAVAAALRKLLVEHISDYQTILARWREVGRRGAAMLHQEVCDLMGPPDLGGISAKDVIIAPFFDEFSGV
ncbi:MAG: hypothetical protein RL417_616 [Pseudomonadota bacterium]|jgi:hypothetical protein